MYNSVHPTRVAGSPRARLLAVAVLASGVLAAGCDGGGSSPGVANVTTTNTSTSKSSNTNNDRGIVGLAVSGGSQSSGSSGSGRSSGFALQIGNVQRALRFSECMRANGAPSFPDPNGQGVIEGSGIDLGSPHFEKASQACTKYRADNAASSPGEKGQFVFGELAFSRCMRSHGMPDFPDPQVRSFGTAVRISFKADSGLDTNSPIYQRAEKECASLLRGNAAKLAAPKD
ncbi:MAG TPA: hypothetical protein VGH56_00750 [Solirubrobacteraceae bacterium]